MLYLLIKEILIKKSVENPFEILRYDCNQIKDLFYN